MMPMPRYGMPSSQSAFFRSTALTILIGLAALIAIVAATLWLVGETRIYSDTLDRARQERAAVAALHILILQAETSQRGYLLTNNEAYLEPYDSAVAKIGPQLDRVRSMLSGADAAPTASRLVTTIDGVLAKLKETIDLARIDGRRDTALALFSSNDERELMVDEQKAFMDLVARADQNISQSVERQQIAISQ